MGKSKIHEREIEFAVTLAQLSLEDVRGVHGVMLSKRWAHPAPAPVRRWWYIDWQPPLILGKLQT